ncbi:hypothetical protein SK128_017044 [Halocaridina rubra]|uniref:Uncharacterized protein n=1 Tax=Halocaridina rubra TaxID=373956 RepID=A0AAN8ZWV0_HALRR
MGVCYSTLGHIQELNLNQTVAGLIGGYRIFFTINSHEYMSYDPGIVSTTTLAEEGIQVSLSDFAMTPTVAANTQAVRIAPKTAASLALTVNSLDRSENYKNIWIWSRPPTCVTKNDYFKMNEEERAMTEYSIYFHHFYRTCPLQLVNCTNLSSRFKDDDTSARRKQVERDTLVATFTINVEPQENEHKEFCITMGINQQLSYTTLVTDTLQDMEGFFLTPNSTLSMINIYYTQLGMTQYYERIPTIFTWFSM